MRRYETIYIVRPNLSEDDINEIIVQTNTVIENLGGLIVQLDRWGLKKLAYLIKKEARGYYIFCEYAGTPEAVDEIERLFRINDKVLKYMTIKLQDVFIADAIVEQQDDEVEGAEPEEKDSTAYDSENSEE